jgi:hypothetical protein
MARLNKAYFFVGFVLALLLVEIACSSGHVVVDFLYYDPSEDPKFCPVCDLWIEAYEDFLAKNETMNRIQSDYGSQVLLNWTKHDSPDGQAEIRFYNITQSNSLVIRTDEGSVAIIQGDFNETYIRTVIDAYLQRTQASSPSSPLPLLAVVTLAFSCFIVPWAGQRFKKESLKFFRH